MHGVSRFILSYCHEMEMEWNFMLVYYMYDCPQQLFFAVRSCAAPEIVTVTDFPIAWN